VEVSAKTRLLAVIGDPVAHSLSPVMHNAAIRALGLDAVYVALGAPAAALPALFGALAAVGAAGNVTVPHKERRNDVSRGKRICASGWARAIRSGPSTGRWWATTRMCPGLSRA